MMQVEGNIPGVGRARIEITGQQISSVEVMGGASDSLPFVSPGFVDIQINGFAGVDFTADDLDAEKAIRMLPAIWSTGATTICPTLVTNTIPGLFRNFAILEQARRMSRDFDHAVPCYHLEGPYLSPDGSHGAHNPDWMHAPDWNEFMELQRAAGGRIGIVTLAPEWPGSDEFIHQATSAGVVVAVGHTDGTADDVHRAAAAGARLNTHLGNGNPNMLHRHKAPLWSQLADDTLQASIICDGFHLPPDVVKVILAVKGLDKVILVTDAVHVAQLPPGKYKLVGTDIELLPTGQVLRADHVSMAGSALTMNRGIKVFMEFSGSSLTQAIQAATTNPARLLGRPTVCSQVATGQPANLVLFREDAHALKVESVISLGRCVHTA